MNNTQPTLWNLDQFTPMQVVEFVRNKLMEQGRRSTTIDNDSCMYRGHDNTKCAVGHLIPDDKYREEFEKNNIATLVLDFPEIDLSNDWVVLLVELQKIHDNVLVCNWEHSFNYLLSNEREVEWA